MLPINFDTICWTCGRDPEKLRRCGLCRVARYCCTECQQSAWSLHAEECAGLKEDYGDLQHHVLPERCHQLPEPHQFPDHTLGAMQTDSGAITFQGWQFIKLESAFHVQKLHDCGLRTLPRAVLHVLERQAYRYVLDLLWKMFVLDSTDPDNHHGLYSAGIPMEASWSWDIASCPVWAVRKVMRSLAWDTQRAMTKVAAANGIGLVLKVAVTKGGPPWRLAPMRVPRSCPDAVREDLKAQRANERIMDLVVCGLTRKRLQPPTRCLLTMEPEGKLQKSWEQHRIYSLLNNFDVCKWRCTSRAGLPVPSPPSGTARRHPRRPPSPPTPPDLPSV